MRKGWFGFLAALASAALSAWAYGRLPERIPTHWNIQGQPDGWSSRLFGATLMPAMTLAMVLLFLALPRIDPLRRNYALHGGTYWTIANSVFLLLFGVHVATLGWSLGWRVRIEQWIPFGVGVLFIVIGNVMSRMRPNWFVGIRTPWTLSSETVWRKTHRLGGYTFVVCGFLIAAAGLVREPWAVPVLVAASVAAAVTPVVYSYVVWRREQAPTSSRV